MEVPPLEKLRKLSSIDENLSPRDSTLEILLENTIQTLSTSINKEFNKSSGSDEALFFLPDMLGFDFLAKVQLARDLSELLFNCKNKRDTILPSQSIESLRNYRPSSLNLTNKDLLSAILNQDQEGVYINANDAEEILKIISDFTNVSETNRHRKPLAANQKEFIMISQRLSKMKKSMRNKQDEIDFLGMSNAKLGDTMKLLQKQEEYLDKMLEDAVYEAYLAEERKGILAKELEEANLSFVDLVKGVGKSERKERLERDDVNGLDIVEEVESNYSMNNPFRLGSMESEEIRREKLS